MLDCGTCAIPEEWIKSIKLTADKPDDLPTLFTVVHIFTLHLLFQPEEERGEEIICMSGC